MQNAGGSIPNTATISFNDGTASLVMDSKHGVLNLPGLANIYYYDNNFSRIATVKGLGTPLYVQASASACNRDLSIAETRVIQIISALTVMLSHSLPRRPAEYRSLQDHKQRKLCAFPRQPGLSVVSRNGIIETIQNDMLTATLDGCGQRLLPQLS